MKRNVDLTENRFFSNSSQLVSRLFSDITGKFPWNFDFLEIKSEDDLDLRHQRKSIIALGDKATRAKIKEYRKMDSLDYCDCCGARMNLKPWDRELGVCHKCNEYYEKSFDRCKWRNKRYNETID